MMKKGRPFLGTTFYDRVIANMTINDQTGCWEFHGTRNDDGYGRI